jgi:3-deoxy-manno-octulosonate cytidylyltransferase (CMP-KDO synthetase)
MGALHPTMGGFAVLDAAVVIPARYASTRLPGKPILESVRKATGKYLIQHVCERAAQAPSVTRVIVATDDERILRAVEDAGGDARMTSPAHRSGTDRIAEVAAGLGEQVIVNIQGDEPDILPEQVEHVIELLSEDETAVMATLAHEVSDEAEWRDPNVVKVVVDLDGYALYFTRSPVPYGRDAEGWDPDGPCTPLHHLGIYAYRRDFLLRYPSMPPAPLEVAEKLEQLRALSAGYRIRVGITRHRCMGIDTPADLQAWLRRQNRH